MPRKKREPEPPKPDRDMHFLGFAKLLMDEIACEDYYAGDEETMTVIAQRAYDLANHIIRHTDETHMRWDEITESPMEYVSRGTNIPDLTQWPKDE